MLPVPILWDVRSRVLVIKKLKKIVQYGTVPVPYHNVQHRYILLICGSIVSTYVCTYDTVIETRHVIKKMIWLVETYCDISQNYIMI